MAADIRGDPKSPPKRRRTPHLPYWQNRSTHHGLRKKGFQDMSVRERVTGRKNSGLREEWGTCRVRHPVVWGSYMWVVWGWVWIYKKQSSVTSTPKGKVTVPLQVKRSSHMKVRGHSQVEGTARAALFQKVLEFGVVQREKYCDLGQCCTLNLQFFLKVQFQNYNFQHLLFTREWNLLSSKPGPHCRANPFLLTMAWHI